MQECRLFKGVIPVVITPLDEDDSIDVAGQQRLIDFLIERQVGGLWALGTNSEDMNLSFRKRLQAAEAICKRNAGRLPLAIGAGFFCMDDTFEFIDATKHLEFDAYHVMPYHLLLSLDRLDWYYRRIADYAPKPLWLYTSANWARPITPGFVKNLSEHSNIAGIKFSNRNTTDLLTVISLARDGFQVITAVAKQFCITLSMGALGSTSSLASCLPEPMQEIYDLFQARDHQGALAAQLRLNEFLDALPKGTHKDNFLPAAEEKYILYLRGICKEYTTSYYRDVNEEEKVAIRHALAKYRMLPDFDTALAGTSTV
ncbi:MAG: dihydrodipicolinate synthase family protein [Gammaproteobacteria bacterium]|nr:dihydrodipicolinate synthase family protein [Gammaproteobacteria bacterium]